MIGFRVRLAVIVLLALLAMGCYSVPEIKQEIGQTIEDPDQPVRLELGNAIFDLSEQNWDQQVFSVNDPESHRLVSLHMELQVTESLETEDRDTPSLDYKVIEEFKLVTDNGATLTPVAVGVRAPNMMLPDGFYDLRFGDSGVELYQTLRTYDLVVVFLYDAGTEFDYFEVAGTQIDANPVEGTRIQTL